MNTDSLYIFHSHDSDKCGDNYLWKGRNTGEYITVMRRRKTLNDVFIYFNSV